MTIDSRDKVLWATRPELGTDGLEPPVGGGKIVGTRDGKRYVRQPSGVITPVEVDAPPFDYDDASGFYKEPKPTLAPELSREQLLTAPEDFSDAAWTGAATVATDDEIAPNGSTTADKIEDTDTNAADYKGQTVTVPNDSADHICPIYLKKKPGSEQTAVLFFSYSGGTTISYVVQVKLKDGTIQDVGTAFTGAGADATDFGVQDRGDYWRVYVAGANNGSGNTSLECRLYPSYGNTLGSFDASDTGSVHAWGANLTAGEFPTSYIDSASTRPADSIHFTGGPDGSEALVGYLRFVAKAEGDAEGGAHRIFDITGSGSSTEGLILHHTNNGAKLYYENSSANNTSAVPSGLYGVGDLVEVAVHVASDASVYAVQSIGEGAETSDTGPAITGGLTAFPLRDLYINDSNAGNRKLALGLYRAFFAKASAVDAALDGTADAAFLSEMRRTVITPGGAVYQAAA